jgi:hypothetical protein
MDRMARYDEGFLRALLIGYTSEKAKIQAAIAEIQSQLNHRGPGRPRTRRRIAAAQRKRWAAVREAKAAPPEARRKLSAAGRKAIIDAMKKRWTAIRVAKAKAARKPKSKAA